MLVGEERKKKKEERTRRKKKEDELNRNFQVCFFPNLLKLSGTFGADITLEY